MSYRKKALSCSCHSLNKSVFDLNQRCLRAPFRPVQILDLYWDVFPALQFAVAPLRGAITLLTVVPFRCGTRMLLAVCGCGNAVHGLAAVMMFDSVERECASAIPSASRGPLQRSSDLPVPSTFPATDAEVPAFVQQVTCRHCLLSVDCARKPEREPTLTRGEHANSTQKGPAPFLLHG